MGYARVSNQVTQLDRDTVSLTGSPSPIRTGETFVELTYQYQLKPWIQLQPDIQYVVRPGAGVPSQDDPSQRIKNEFIIGLRTNISF